MKKNQLISRILLQLDIDIQPTRLRCNGGLMRLSSVILWSLLLATPGYGAEGTAILADDPSTEGELVVAQFSDLAASCLSRIGENRQFVLDLSTDHLWLVSSARLERAIVDQDSIRDWHLALAAFAHEQKEIRERVMTDETAPEELKKLLSQHPQQSVNVPPQRTWRSQPEINSQAVDGLLRLRSRLASSAAQVREALGTNTERLAPFECLVDATMVPFTVVQAGDDTPPIRFVPIRRSMASSWRNWTEVSLSSLATQGFDPKNPDKLYE